MFMKITHIHSQCFLIFLSLVCWRSSHRTVEAGGVGINWGTQASHLLRPSVVVRMLQDNNITSVKLFDSDTATLSALAGTGMAVMVAIPNKLLQDMNDPGTASSWVQQNVARYIFQGGVNIKYVGVGNEPFLSSYNGTFVNLTFPALQNIQNALNDAKLGDTIKATVPMNADVLTNPLLPSQGTFQNNTMEKMLQILNLLSTNGCPFVVNIYPFISLYTNPSFPQNYLFFDSNIAQVQDGSRSYTNTFDATYDTLVAALAAAGYANMSIIVGEVGWPTDGFVSATPQNAQRFTQGFLNHVLSNAGTPARPNIPIQFYLFSVLDEDQKSIEPGDFERHWGIFAYDGTVKYSLSLGQSGQQLVNATGVEYLTQQWCVVAGSPANLSTLADPVSYACSNSDCTELGYGASCNGVLDTLGNASFAFNQYFQMNSQAAGSCNFDSLATITDTDPSVGSCKFIVQVAASDAAGSRKSPGVALLMVSVLFVLFL